MGGKGERGKLDNVILETMERMEQEKSAILSAHASEFASIVELVKAERFADAALLYDKIAAALSSAHLPLDASFYKERALSCRRQLKRPRKRKG